VKRAAMFAVIFCATRFAVVPLVIPEWFHRDDRLNACISPFRLLTGTVRDTALIPKLSFIASYWLFDFSPTSARIPTIVLASIGLAFYGAAFGRAFGRYVGCLSLILILVTVQLVIHPVVPTNVSSAFWLSGPCVYLLTGKLDHWRVALIAILCAGSLLCYPAGAIAVLPCLAVHCVVFRAEWKWRGTFTLIAWIVICTGIVWAIRLHFEANPSLFHWSIHRGSFDLERWCSVSMLMLENTFMSAHNFYAFSGDHPYLAPELSILLVLSLVAMPRRHRRWSAVFIGGFIGSVVISGLVPHSPGARRIIVGSVLLIPVSLLVLQSLWGAGPRRTVLAMFASVLIVLCGLARTGDALVNWGQLPLHIRTDNRAFVSSSLAKLENAGYTERVVITGPIPEFDACAIYFSHRSRGRFGSIETIESTGDRTMILGGTHAPTD